MKKFTVEITTIEKMEIETILKNKLERIKEQVEICRDQPTLNWFELDRKMVESLLKKFKEVKVNQS